MWKSLSVSIFLSLTVAAGLRAQEVVKRLAPPASAEGRTQAVAEILKQSVEEPLRFAEVTAQFPRWRVGQFLREFPKSTADRVRHYEQIVEEVRYAKAFRSSMQAVVHNGGVKAAIPLLSYWEHAEEAEGYVARGQYDEATVTVLNASVEVPLVNLSAGFAGVASGAAITEGLLLAGVGYPAFLGIVGGGYVAVKTAEGAKSLYDAYLEPNVKRLARSALDTVDRLVTWQGLTPGEQARYERRRLADIEANKQAALLDAFPSTRGVAVSDAREVQLRTSPAIAEAGVLPERLLTENCTVHTVGWWLDEPGKTWSSTWEIRDGKITTPGTNFTFRGTLNGNVVTGGWTYADGGGVNEKLVFHPGGKLTWDADIYGPDASGVMRHFARKGAGTWEIPNPPAGESKRPTTESRTLNK